MFEYLQPEKSFPNALDTVVIYKDPFGVVLVIGAWNYPLQLTMGPVAGAIAAGNCVIIKPSEVAPASAKFMAETIPKYLDNVSYYYSMHFYFLFNFFLYIFRLLICIRIAIK